MELSYPSIFTSVRLGKGEKYRFEVEVEPPPHWDAPSVQKIGTQTINILSPSLTKVGVGVNIMVGVAYISFPGLSFILIEKILFQLLKVKIVLAF